MINIKFEKKKLLLLLFEDKIVVCILITQIYNTPLNTAILSQGF